MRQFCTSKTRFNINQNIELFQIKKSTIVFIDFIVATISLSAQPILRGTGYNAQKERSIRRETKNK